MQKKGQKKHWRHAVAGAAAVSMTLAAGCSGQGDQTQPTADTQGRKEITLKMIRYEHPLQATKQDTPVLKAIAEKTGVTLQVEGVPQSNYTEKKQVLIGTNNVPDIILVNQNDINQYAKTGIFLNISDYLDQAPHLKKRLEENPETKKLLIDGKLYGFPITAQNQLSAGKAPMIRTDLLAKHNLKPPQRTRSCTRC